MLEQPKSSHESLWGALKTVELKVQPYPGEPQLWATEITLDGKAPSYAAEKNVQAADRDKVYALLEAEVCERWPHRISGETVFKRS